MWEHAFLEMPMCRELRNRVVSNGVVGETDFGHEAGPQWAISDDIPVLNSYVFRGSFGNVSGPRAFRKVPEKQQKLEIPNAPFTHTLLKRPPDCFREGRRLGEQRGVLLRSAPRLSAARAARARRIPQKRRPLLRWAASFSEAVPPF